MSNIRSNAAYDLSNFAPQPKQQPEIKVIKSNARKRKTLAMLKIKLTALAVVIVALMCVTVYNKMKLTELVSMTDEAQSKLVNVQNDIKRLDVELEGVVSIKEADQYAKNVLKLQKKDAGQVIYLTLNDGNYIEKTEQEKSIYSLMRIGIAAVQDYFG